MGGGGGHSRSSWTLCRRQRDKICTRSNTETTRSGSDGVESGRPTSSHTGEGRGTILTSEWRGGMTGRHLQLLCAAVCCRAVGVHFMLSGFISAGNSCFGSRRAASPTCNELKDSVLITTSDSLMTPVRTFHVLLSPSPATSCVSFCCQRVPSL